ncbi:hypothetical protein ACFLY0_01050 [Patescibacteria group bacterium]
MENDQTKPLFSDDVEAVSVLIHECNSRASFSVIGHKECFLMEEDGSIVEDEQCSDPETRACLSDEVCPSRTITRMKIGDLREHLRNLQNQAHNE